MLMTSVCRMPPPSAVAAPASSNTFREECETDLFGEQVVALRRLGRLIKAGFENAGGSRLRTGDGLLRVLA